MSDDDVVDLRDAPMHTQMFAILLFAELRWMKWLDPDLVAEREDRGETPPEPEIALVEAMELPIFSAEVMKKKRRLKLLFCLHMTTFFLVRTWEVWKGMYFSRKIVLPDNVIQLRKQDAR